MTNEQIEAIFIEYIKKYDGINNCFGHFKFNTSDRIGQGGNGIVYSATIDDKCVAIKFLTTDSKKKYLRFKSEFFNTNYVKNKLINIVNMIQYDELKLTDEISIPYIIMSKYEKNLKKYRDTIKNIVIQSIQLI